MDFRKLAEGIGTFYILKCTVLQMESHLVAYTMSVGCVARFSLFQVSLVRSIIDSVNRVMESLFVLLGGITETDAKMSPQLTKKSRDKQKAGFEAVTFLQATDNNLPVFTKWVHIEQCFMLIVVVI